MTAAEITALAQHDPPWTGQWIGGAPPDSAATLTLSGPATTLDVATLSLARDAEGKMSLGSRFSVLGSRPSLGRNRDRATSQFRLDVARAVGGSPCGHPPYAGYAGCKSSGQGATFQIFSAYSRIARSEEKGAMRAVLRMDMRSQRGRSIQARATCSWHSQ